MFAKIIYNKIVWMVIDVSFHLLKFGICVCVFFFIPLFYLFYIRRFVLTSIHTKFMLCHSFAIRWFVDCKKKIKIHRYWIVIETYSIRTFLLWYEPKTTQIKPKPNTTIIGLKNVFKDIFNSMLIYLKTHTNKKFS